MILLDTSGLFAALNPDQANHPVARSVVDAEPPPLILSPFVLAEVDYFLVTRGGVDRELRLISEVSRRAYELASFDAGDVALAATVIEQYHDLRIGLADASIVVLAGRYRTNRVLTLDEKHFRSLRTPHGEPFVVLPADA